MIYFCHMYPRSREGTPHFGLDPHSGEGDPHFDWIHIETERGPQFGLDSQTTFCTSIST